MFLSKLATIVLLYDCIVDGKMFIFSHPTQQVDSCLSWFPGLLAKNDADEYYLSLHINLLTNIYFIIVNLFTKFKKCWTSNKYLHLSSIGL